MSYITQFTGNDIWMTLCCTVYRVHLSLPGGHCVVQYRIDCRVDVKHQSGEVEEIVKYLEDKTVFTSIHVHYSVP